MRPLTFHAESCCVCKSTEGLHELSEFGKAVCSRCLPAFVRRRVNRTVARYQMIRKGETVAVAVSGGADSSSLLHMLHALRSRLYFHLLALHVDMGLGEYSERSRQACERLAERLGVRLVVERVADCGVRIEPVKQWPMCAVCGGVRRCLLPRAARREGAEVLATGHTLDDQLQYALKNLLSGRLEAPPPVRSATPSAPRKVKPLYLVPDSASDLYVQLEALPTCSDVCPTLNPDAHRLKRVFELLEELAPMGKPQVLLGLHKGLRSRAREKPEHPCPDCREPTTMAVCPLCRLRRWQQQGGEEAPSPSPADRSRPEGRGPG
jgi:tRNA(Ile)-lysidine synthase TilS/MesJ